MIQNIYHFFRANERMVLLVFVLVFVLLRIPSVDRSLHQDEYKWPLIVNPESVGAGILPHPPLSEAIYRAAGELVGYDVDFRYVPLFFGTINLVLLYILMKMLYGRKEAMFAALLWIISFFSVLASLVVDTDGQILPFFFLLALIAYHKLEHFTSRHYKAWLAVLIGACVLGLLVKLSFVLAVAAIVADFLWSKKGRLGGLDFMRYGAYTLFALLVLTGLLFLSPLLFPFFDLSASFAYWEHFFNFDRAWFQTAIQCVKAILYASPLLLLPFFITGNTLARLRPLFFFLGFAFVFYIVLFDFSAGALDRYLQLIILPLVAFGGVALAKVFGDDEEASNWNVTMFFLIGCIAALALSLLQFLPHYIPPLHPKSEWITRVLTLRWDFVFPFHGGSGPLGFYVSFLYIALSWFASLAALVAAWFKPQYCKQLLAFFIPIALLYNLVFIEEYHFGVINGSAPKLLIEAVEFMKNNDDIKQVITYNDNGGAEIQAIGKYERRYYVAPIFKNDTKTNTFANHYFELNVPRPPDGPYQHSFDSCEIVYKATDKKMTAIVYDCRKEK